MIDLEMQIHKPNGDQSKKENGKTPVIKEEYKTA
jgi:hypothetical protein